MASPRGRCRAAESGEGAGVWVFAVAVLPLVLLLWFILFVRGAGWSLKYKHDVWIVLFQILCSFLRRPHTDRFPDDVLVKVTAKQEL